MINGYSLLSNYYKISICLIMIDIRKMAIKVNDRLKLLIIEEDDSDIATDIADEVQVNLLSGSPAKRSPGGCKVEDSTS